MKFRVFLLPLALMAASVFFSSAAWSQPLPDRRPVTGHVFDSAGKPIANAVVTIRRQDDLGPYAFWGTAAATDNVGGFRFARAEIGKYYLNVEAPGFAPIFNQNLIWDSSTSALRLQLDRLVVLKLRFLKPNGSADGFSSAYIRLRGDGNAGQTTKRISTDQEGLIVIPDVLPARYSLFAWTKEGYMLQNDLLIRSNQTLDINLKSGGTLRTTVRDETSKPLGGATLTLVPENSNETLRLLGSAGDPADDIALLSTGNNNMATVSKDGDGTIDVKNIPPGHFLARLALLGYQTGEVRSVSFEVGQVVELNWTATRRAGIPGTLNIHLKNADGSIAAIGDYMLRLLNINPNGSLSVEESSPDVPFSPGGNIGRRATSDNSGTLTLFPVNIGHYRIFASPRRAQSDVDAAAIESASVDVSVSGPDAEATLVLKAAQ